MSERLERDYFEKLYAESTDPWEFATSEYESRKYAQTLGALESRRFRRALEVGASIGVFTEMLAPYCDELVAVDTSSRAVNLARNRLAGSEHVLVEQRTLPEEMPEGPFDLIVAAEVLYYLPRQILLQTLRAFEIELAPGGMVLAVHWRRETATYPLQGDEVHEVLYQHLSLANVKTLVEPEYRLDLFEDAS
ncbi:class I SAM-dependent methyltransferase [soil metagenome]